MEAANIEQLQQDAERNAREQLPAFIPVRAVCKITGFSKSTLLRMRKAGKFNVRPVIEEGNCVRYDLGAVLEWRREQFQKRNQRMEKGQA